MISLVEIAARQNYWLWLRYSDGVAGEVDLSHLAGRGVFRAWDALGRFQRAHIDRYGAVSWGAEVELCPQALYLELTGKEFDELPTGTAAAEQDA